MKNNSSFPKMPNLNYSNFNTPTTEPKQKLSIAILLGLLTFVVTPLVAIIIAVPFFFLVQISDNLNPIVIIASLFGLRKLGGFFLAQFILIATLALLGDFVTAIISWFTNRSKKLATITFISALIFQIVVISITIPRVMKQSQRTLEVGIEAEKSYQQFAKIGDIGYDIEPYPASEPIGNSFPEYGSMGKKLELIVPVSVDQEGTYLVTAQYRVSKGDLSANTPIKDATQYLNVGDNIARVEFLANESGGSYGFWSPEYVGGTAQIQLFYLASEKELLDKITSNSGLDKKIFNQFLKDEGLDKREVQTKPTINKFIEKKDVQF